jgi:hypothetical protein
MMLGLRDASPVAARLVASAIGAALAVLVPPWVFPERRWKASLAGAASVVPITLAVVVCSGVMEMGSGENYRAGVPSGALAGLGLGVILAILFRPATRRNLGLPILLVLAGTLIAARLALPPVCRGLFAHTTNAVLPRIEDLVRTDMLRELSAVNWGVVHGCVHWADDCFGVDAAGDGSNSRGKLGLIVGGQSPLWPASDSPGDLAGLRVARLWVMLHPAHDLKEGELTPDVVKRLLLDLGVRPELVERLGPAPGASAPAAIRWRARIGSAGDLYGEYRGLYYHVHTFPAPANPGPHYQPAPRLDLWCTGTRS